MTALSVVVVMGGGRLGGGMGRVGVGRKEGAVTQFANTLPPKSVSETDRETVPAPPVAFCSQLRTSSREGVGWLLLISS